MTKSEHFSKLKPVLPLLFSAKARTAPTRAGGQGNCISKHCQKRVVGSCFCWLTGQLAEGVAHRELTLAINEIETACDVSIAMDAWKDKGLAARLNEAVSHAQGAYVARMDADDIMYPDRLRLQINYLTAHPETDLLGGSMLVFKGEGEAYAIRLARTTHEQICGSFPSGMSLFHPTWMGKRSWFQRHPYDCTMTRTEDRELLLRAHRVSKYAALPEIVLGYREDSPVLAKKLPARFALARGYLLYARRERRFLYGLLGAVAEYFKAVQDLIMVGMGLGRAMWRPQRKSLCGAAMNKWSEVLLGVRQAACHVPTDADQ